jgi:hypothetical protein
MRLPQTREHYVHNIQRVLDELAHSASESLNSLCRLAEHVVYCRARPKPHLWRGYSGRRRARDKQHAASFLEDLSYHKEHTRHKTRACPPPVRTAHIHVRLYIG